MQPLTLYHVPPSFYSQIARLALVEAGLDFTEKIVIPGPSFGPSTYAPNYMKLNRQGTVPTLLIGDQVLDDSRKIINWVAGLELQPALVPAAGEARAAMDDWIARSYALSERELAYGRGILKTLGRFGNRKRLKTLRRFKAQNPDMVAIYDAKIADIEDFMGKAGDERHVKALGARFDDEFTALDQLLADRDFIAGTGYSLADTCWTVGAARHQMLKSDPIPGRPNLARWFKQMKQRPSYQGAGIMDHFSFKPLGKILAAEFSGK